MLRFLWPTLLNQSPGVLARFGRVLHWLATFGTGALLILGAIASTTLATGYSTWDSLGPGLLLALAVAIGLYFTGRALRYIFSGE